MRETAATCGVQRSKEVHDREVLKEESEGILRLNVQLCIFLRLLILTSTFIGVSVVVYREIIAKRSTVFFKCLRRIECVHKRLRPGGQVQLRIEVLLLISTLRAFASGFTGVIRAVLLLVRAPGSAWSIGQFCVFESLQQRAHALLTRAICAARLAGRCAAAAIWLCRGRQQQFDGVAACAFLVLCSHFLRRGDAVNLSLRKSRGQQVRLHVEQVVRYFKSRAARRDRLQVSQPTLSTADVDRLLGGGEDVARAHHIVQSQLTRRQNKEWLADELDDSEAESMERNKSETTREAERKR